MTYFDFLLFFVVPPIVVLAVLARPKARHGLAIAFLCVVTYVWTTPWDNYLVASGVWAYRPAQVSGVVFGFVPLEEYLFFGLQAVLGSLWTLTLYRLARSDDAFRRLSTALAIALAWTIGPIVATAIGAASRPAIGSVETTQAWPPLPFGQANYLILILVWAVPVILGQWAIGARLFKSPLWVWALGWLVPTLYLSASDSVAIASGVWHILPDQSLGLHLPLGNAGLPLEEAVFFLVTSMLVTQGFLLASAPEAGATLRGWLNGLTGGKGVRA